MLKGWFYIFAFVNYLCLSFACFPLCFLVFPPLSPLLPQFYSVLFLCVSGISPLSLVCVGNIFSQFAILILPVVMFSPRKKFLFRFFKPIYNCFSLNLDFEPQLKSLYPPTFRLQRNHQCFLLILGQFCFFTVRTWIRVLLSGVRSCPNTIY